MLTSSPPTSAPGTDKTGMDFRRILPEIRCQSCLSPGSEPTPLGGFFAPRCAFCTAWRVPSGRGSVPGFSPSGRRTPAVEDFAEVVQADRLGEMIVHAGLQAGFAVGGKGVGGEGDHGGVARAVFAGG